MTDDMTYPKQDRFNFGYNDLEMRKKSMCKLLSESCRLDRTPIGPMNLKPMPFEIMEEVVFIPFPIGGH